MPRETKIGPDLHAGEMGEVAALDLGCSTGATTFELARCFHVVVGVDQAQHFINAAKVDGAVDRGLPPETIMLDVTQAISCVGLGYRPALHMLAAQAAAVIPARLCTFTLSEHTDCHLLSMPLPLTCRCCRSRECCLTLLWRRVSW